MANNKKSSSAYLGIFAFLILIIIVVLLGAAIFDIDDFDEGFDDDDDQIETRKNKKVKKYKTPQSSSTKYSSGEPTQTSKAEPLLRKSQPYGYISKNGQKIENFKEQIRSFCVFENKPYVLTHTEIFKTLNSKKSQKCAMRQIASTENEILGFDGHHIYTYNGRFISKFDASGFSVSNEGTEIAILTLSDDQQLVTIYNANWEELRKFYIPKDAQFILGSGYTSMSIEQNKARLNPDHKNGAVFSDVMTGSALGPDGRILRANNNEFYYVKNSDIYFIKNP